MNDVTPDQTTIDEEPPSGCLATVGALGMAGYVLVILGFACAGLVGVTATSLGVVLDDLHLRQGLVTGLDVDVWRLKSLRESDILPPERSPALYIDDSDDQDASSGCMVVDGTLIRWQDMELDGRIEVAGSQVQEATIGDPSSVTVRREAESITCLFERASDAESFSRMLAIESRD